MKDPAFLFYSSDFLSGTMLMTDEEVGQYIKLLCLQHQKGHLKEKDILNICKTHNEDIFSKFKKDEEGNYYNERLEYESNKRKAYSESRRNNRKKKETYEEDMKNICNSYEKHMENENVIVNENINININKNNRKRGYKGEKEEVSDSCVDGLQEIINFYNENIGMITPYGIEILSDYAKEMPIDLIIYAMQISVEANKKTIQYIKAILNNWQKAGIKILADAKKESSKGKPKEKGKFEERKYDNLDFLYANMGGENE